MLVDPRDFMKFISNEKSKAIKRDVDFFVDRTCWMADLYNKNSLNLEEFFLEVKECYKSRPLFSKIVDTLISPLYDLRRDVQQEIDYRKEHTREPDDWKKLFKKTAEIFENKGLEELAQYMGGKAIEDYYSSRVTREDSAR